MFLLDWWYRRQAQKAEFRAAMAELAALNGMTARQAARLFHTWLKTVPCDWRTGYRYARCGPAGFLLLKHKLRCGQQP